MSLMSVCLQIALVALALWGSAFFSASEMALISANQIRVRQRLGHVPFDTGQMIKVIVLAVAAAEPGENAKHLGPPLRTHDRVLAREGGDVEACIGLTPDTGVM